MGRLERMEQRKLKIEKGVAKMKTAMHSSGRVKSTVERTSNTVVEEEEHKDEHQPLVE